MNYEYESCPLHSQEIIYYYSVDYQIVAKYCIECFDHDHEVKLLSKAKYGECVKTLKEEHLVTIHENVKTLDQVYNNLRQFNHFQQNSFDGALKDWKDKLDKLDKDMSSIHQIEQSQAQSQQYKSLSDYIQLQNEECNLAQQFIGVVGKHKKQALNTYESIERQLKTLRDVSIQKSKPVNEVMRRDRI